MKNGQSHASYEYDNRGNQQIEIIKKEIDGAMKDVTTNYSYDLANQLTAVETITPGKETTTLKNVYNGDGQRIRRDANGLVTKYLYHDDAILYTTDNNNGKTTENILNPTGMIVASKRFEGGHANNHFFYQYDIRGSVTNVVDSDAKRVKGYEYDDFGKPKEVGDKTIENDVKFTGAVHDASTGLHYMNARYYNSDTGRFLSQDTYSGSPNDPWTQHLYTYTSNNPVNYTDPTGHYAVNVEGTQRQLPTGRIITEPKPSNTISPGSQDRPTTKSSTKKATSSESKKSSFFGSLQKGLDFLGNAPGPIGAVADGINALAYAAQGDFKNAALSGVAVLPGGSLVKNGIKAGRGLRFAAKGKGNDGLKLDLQFFGRSEKLQPDKTATGSHTVFQRHGETGAIKKYQTFQPQTNPKNPTPWESVKRFDTGGGSHFNTVLKREVPTPHVHDPLSPGGVRAPYNWEIPRVK